MTIKPLWKESIAYKMTNHSKQTKKKMLIYYKMVVLGSCHDLVQKYHIRHSIMKYVNFSNPYEMIDLLLGFSWSRLGLMKCQTALTFCVIKVGNKNEKSPS